MSADLPDLVQAITGIRDFLCALAKRRGRDPDELGQVVAQRVLRRLRAGARPEKLRGYCMTVARREVGRPDAYLARAVPVPRGLAAPTGDPLAAAIATEERERVAIALESLNVRQRATIRRFYWDGIPFNNDNTEARRASRARAKLVGVLAATTA